MNTPGPADREYHDLVDEHPLGAGVVGIALVALAVLAVSVAAAVIVVVALLIAG